MFKYVVGEQTLDLALVQSMDSPLGTRRTVDRDLRFTRLRARPAALSEFISIHSIIRGALLVPDYDSDTDFFVVDYVDTDMFLRSRRKFF
jgi:hypothetical protein